MLRVGQGSLHTGDNLTILREKVVTASVDLIYLDPPFCSQKVYDLVEGAHGGPKKRSFGFNDAWRWNDESRASFDEVKRTDARAGRLLDALRVLLGEGELLAYLTAMALRLPELHRALAPTGSLYLHCDPTASHYLKVLLDTVFGPRCFRNEITWRYRRWPARSKQYQKMHDVLLYYSKSDDGKHTFHTLYGYERLAESTQKTFGTKKQIANFASGHRKPGTLDEETAGPPLSDVWEVSVIAPIGKERTGYPTQKPEALLERVIRASSAEGDLVLDPFCGSGTTLAVAERLGRRWMGIDKNADAVRIASSRIAALAELRRVG